MINKNNVRNILIVRTDRLGDVILTLPLITEARKIFKKSKILFLINRYLEDLIKNYNGIDELLIEENIGGFFDKYRFLKFKDIDLVINVKPRFDLALLFFILRIKYRIGTAYRWYSFLYNYKVYQHRKISDRHESDYNLKLLSNFFVEVSTDKEFFFKYTDEERNSLNAKLFLLLDKNYVIVHPGSGGSSKDLPFETFSSFLNGFMTEFDEYEVVLTGIESEKLLINKLKHSVKIEFENRVSDLCGILNLRELMILIDNSRLFISNSTGPIHIAGALNKKTIGFYPNEKKISDTRWKPLSSNSIILKPNDNSDHMNSIGVDKIMKAVRNFLRNKTC